MQTINVLGRDYTIAFRKEAEDVKLKECGAYCDYSRARKSVTNWFTRSPMRVDLR